MAFKLKRVWDGFSFEIWEHRQAGKKQTHDQQGVHSWGIVGSAGEGIIKNKRIDQTD